MTNKDLFFLTNPQKSIWNMEKFFEGTNINNICASMTILDKTQVNYFKEAVQNVVKNNDAFRIRILIENNSPVQYISEYKPFDIEEIDLNSDNEADSVLKTMINHKFNIIDSNLFLFKILKFKDGHATLLFSVHHLIADSWSLGLFTRTVMKEYNSLTKKTQGENNQNSYLEYMNSEEKYKSTKKYEIDKEYWAKKFEILPDTVTFPSYSAQKNIDSINSKREAFRVNINVAKNIKSFCSKHKISTFNFFMAIYSIYLRRITGLDEFVIGTPILNRANFQEKQTMGMFVNTIPFKLTFSNNIKFIDFTYNLSINLLEDFRHQKYSYTQILEDLRKKGNKISSLFNVSISYQITKAVDKEDGNYTTGWYPNNFTSNDCTIHITDLNDTGELTIDYDYLAEKYTKKDICDLHSRIEYIINQLLLDENSLIDDLDITTPEEKNKILNDFNNTKVNYPNNKDILNIFEEQAKKNPENTAVIFQNKKITFKELDEKSSILASNLERFDISNNDIVAIFIDRSIELITSILGVIKSKANFVLIDTSLPEERVNYILNDSGAKLCIKKKSIANADDLDVNIEINPFAKNTSPISKDISDNLCVIYTSGSTGKPKGVILHKSGYYNLLNAFETDFNISQYKRCLSIATVSFDMFVFEVFSSLMFGNTLVLADYEEQRNPIAMSNLIKNNNVEFLVTTPSRADLLLLKECDNPLKNVKAILFGGEKFTNNLLNRLRKATNAKIFNSFGPTEITSACTNKLITSDDITIGKPLPNTEVYICDSKLKLLPIGVIGEICIAGKRCFKWILKQTRHNKRTFCKKSF